ncbi:MAG: hypothetical protein K9L86_04580 [Candidatus Omnitrophica bacterium]|nr:hypothetical protein [Candidatus Omnitrophota bacterium]
MKPVTISISIMVFSFFVFQNVFSEGRVVDIETGLPGIEGKANDEPLDRCTDRCGDGFCQDKGCGSRGFTCCETAESCPKDCFRDKKATQELFGKLRELKKGSFQNKLDIDDSEEESDQPEVVIQKGEGVITRCNYRAGSRACGACYCLKASKGNTIVFNGRKLRGCARLDISQVGDLSNFVDKAVFYKGTSDFDTTFICPQHFQLFSIEEAE